MNQPQEVIFYRNPLEYHFWHGIMSSDDNIGLGIVTLCAVMFICTIVLAIVSDKLWPHQGDKYMGWILTASAILGCVACYFVL